MNAHHDDTLEMLVAEYLAARQELLDLLRQFTDEQLAAPVPTVGGDGGRRRLVCRESGACDRAHDRD